ncbi:MAG: hypothetical protein Q7N87_05135 [Candidatus Uhrbacteria bacterium]|nr:hypothetical protein [Candidatus Uhrbacteria bacterium]
MTYGPRDDDWNTQGLDEAEDLGNLAAIDVLSKDEKELDDEGEPKVVEEIVDEEEEVDGLKALDRLEKQIKREEMSLQDLGVEEEE